MDELVGQIDSLEIFLRKKLPAEMKQPPLKEHLETLVQIRSQDLEPDPSGGGGVKIREGVAPDRRVSIEDADMRHGRKSSSKLFNGYKRHVATDLDTGFILACTVMPANKGEGEAAPVLKDDIARQIRRIAELHCDRGYIASTAVSEVIAQGGPPVRQLSHGKLDVYQKATEFLALSAQLIDAMPKGHKTLVDPLRLWLALRPQRRTLRRKASSTGVESTEPSR